LKVGKRKKGEGGEIQRGARNKGAATQLQEETSSVWKRRVIQGTWEGKFLTIWTEDG